MKKYKEYALYKGEELLAIGTKKELAEKFNVKEKTITYYMTPAHLKRNSKSHIGNYKVVIVLDQEENMYPKKLSKKDKKELKKQFPKRNLTKEEIKLKQERTKARVENICYFLVTIFFLIMLAVAIYILYLMLTYKW